jgi:hypothetical protein
MKSTTISDLNILLTIIFTTSYKSIKLLVIWLEATKSVNQWEIRRCFLLLETKSKKGRNNHILNLLISNIGRRTHNNKLYKRYRHKSGPKTNMNNISELIKKTDMKILNNMKFFLTITTEFPTALFCNMLLFPCN